MGKRNYLNLRKANKQAKFQGHSTPNSISYKELAQVINTIDIGTVKNLSDLFSDYKYTCAVYRAPDVRAGNITYLLMKRDLTN